MTIELPEAVTSAIDGLSSGEKPDLARAHSLLQEAVLGAQGCLRTDLPRRVDWAEAAWGEFVALLRHEDNHVRSIAGQMLSNLAQSAECETALRDLPQAVAATRDEKFVTARHVLQALWKYGLGPPALREALLVALSRRFEDSASEKNATLIRSDFIAGLRALHDRCGDPAIPEAAEQLISREPDPKYRKKYVGVWRDLAEPRQQPRQGPH